jgi:hypothetical protein
MDFLGILELVIGLIFIYFLLGLVTTVIQEIIAKSLNLRANNLENWLKDTFNKKGKDLAEKILGHKLIDGLTKKGRKASYYPTRVFINALLDVINSEEDDGRPYNLDSIKNKIKSSDLLPDEFKRTMVQSISEARGDMERFKKDVGNWFDQAMIRITGSYKKHTQKALLFISVCVVLAMNADTISLAKYFHDNPVQRKTMVQQVEQMAASGELEAMFEEYGVSNDSSATTGDDPVEELRSEIASFKALNESIGSYKLPLGWESYELWPFDKAIPNLIRLLKKILGLAFTAFAVSIGAPFWFDTLNKLVNLKSAGNLPKTKFIKK